MNTFVIAARLTAESHNDVNNQYQKTIKTIVGDSDLSDDISRLYKYYNLETIENEYVDDIERILDGLSSNYDHDDEISKFIDLIYEKITLIIEMIELEGDVSKLNNEYKKLIELHPDVLDKFEEVYKK